MLHEVRHAAPHRAGVVEHHVAEGAAGGEVVDLDDGGGAPRHALEVLEVRFAVAAAHDQPRHAVAVEVAQVLEFEVGAVLVVGHDHAVAALAEPAGVPAANDAEAKTGGVNFLTH